VVALVDLAIQRIEHETVRAQFFRRDAINAIVVLVALLVVLVLAILGGAIVRSICNNAGTVNAVDFSPLCGN